MLTRQDVSRLIQTEFQRIADIDIDSIESPFSSPAIYHPLEFLMADKTVTIIISKSLEQTPKFFGKSDQNFEEWLQDLNAKFHIAKITEIQVLKIISTFLGGPVKDWFTENSATFESWKHFKDVFHDAYASPAAKQLASHRLRTRQQRSNEPIIEHYTNVMK